MRLNIGTVMDLKFNLFEVFIQAICDENSDHRHKI